MLSCLLVSAFRANPAIRQTTYITLGKRTVMRNSSTSGFCLARDMPSRVLYLIQSRNQQEEPNYSSFSPTTQTRPTSPSISLSQIVPYEAHSHSSCTSHHMRIQYFQYLSYTTALHPCDRKLLFRHLRTVPAFGNHTL